MVRFRNLKDLLSGTIFIVIGLTFFFASSVLPQGSAERMGPGYFPLLLSVMLSGAGLLIIARGLIVDGEAPGDFAVRGLLFVVLGAVVFALLVRPAGFVPAIALSVFVTTFASRESRLLNSVLLALGMTIGSWLIFVVALRLPWAPLGTWFGF